MDGGGIGTDRNEDSLLMEMVEVVYLKVFV